jgi:hypothetical protein
MTIPWSGQNTRYLNDHQNGGLMARQSDESAGSYEQARRLRRGWQLWVGDGWAEVRSAVARDDTILITVTDGRVFRVDYLESVLCRKPAPSRLTMPGWPGDQSTCGAARYPRGSR